MYRLRMNHFFKYFTVFITLFAMVCTITLPHQEASKSHQTKPSGTSTETENGALVTPIPTSTASNDGVAVYRYMNSRNGATCILLKTDAVVEIKFILNTFEEQADTFVPEKALVDGNCKNEDASYMSISWSGYNLVLNFAKTLGGERWYISSVQLTVSPDLPKFKDIKTKGKPIKLYHRDMLIPTPVGKSYRCAELNIDLKPDENDHGPEGLHGSLLLRLLHVQAFMFKSEDFGPAFECKSQTSFRDETAPIAVGSTLAIAVLVTITGYGIFRYFKVKNVQYNTME